MKKQTEVHRPQPALEGLRLRSELRELRMTPGDRRWAAVPMNERTFDEPVFQRPTEEDEAESSKVETGDVARIIAGLFG